VTEYSRKQHLKVQHIEKEIAISIAPADKRTPRKGGHQRHHA